VLNAGETRIDGEISWGNGHLEHKEGLASVTVRWILGRYVVWMGGS